MNIRRILAMMLVCLLMGCAMAEQPMTETLLPTETLYFTEEAPENILGRCTVKYNSYGLPEEMFTDDGESLVLNSVWDGDRLLEMNTESGGKLSFQYDAAQEYLVAIWLIEDDLITEKYELRNEEDYSFVYTYGKTWTAYDQNYHCTCINTSSPDGENTYIYRYEYSEKGNLILIQRFDNFSNTAAYKASYTDEDYDAVGNCLAQWQSTSDSQFKASIADQFSYEYDNEGNISAVTYGDRTTFYDANGRRIKWVEVEGTVHYEAKYEDISVVNDPLLLFYLHVNDLEF